MIYEIKGFMLTFFYNTYSLKQGNPFYSRKDERTGVKAHRQLVGIKVYDF